MILLADTVGLLMVIMGGVYGYGKLNQRVLNLENNQDRLERQRKEEYDRLHEDHLLLEKQVASANGKLNKAIGILSMAFPEAASTLGD